MDCVTKVGIIPAVQRCYTDIDWNSVVYKTQYCCEWSVVDNNLSYYGQFPHFRNIIKALEEEKMTNTKKVRRQASRDRDKISAPN